MELGNILYIYQQTIQVEMKESRREYVEMIIWKGVEGDINNGGQHDIYITKQ